MSYIEIDYNNVDPAHGNHAVRIGDIELTAIADKNFGADNDVTIGGTGDDTIDGGADNDSIVGKMSDDTLEGDAGDDTLNGGAGNDSIIGGTGDDQIILENGFGVDTIDGSDDLGNGDIDVLNAGAMAADATLGLSGADPESGTLTFGVNVATFDNIETVMLGAGDDSVIGSDGNDTISTGGGADTIKMGAGDDVVDLGAGGSDYDADVIVLEDGFGNDTIAGFDAPTSNGNSTFTGIDTLDVSGLYDLPVGDPDRMPVMTNDIVVSDDGSGNAVLTFPNGETITLNGISPADADDTDFLHAIGIPLPDGTVEGTAGDDIIDQSYIGDPDGDMVDGNDAILPGDTGDDDLIYGYGGTDSITAGNGDDRIFGGDGNDNIDGGLGNDYLYGGLGNDTIEGGDGGDALYAGSGNDTLDGGDGNDTLVGGSGIDTMSGGEGGLDYDTIDISADTVPVTVTFSDDETGTITAGTNTISFSEIEHIILTSQDDVVDGTAATLAQPSFSPHPTYGLC